MNRLVGAGEATVEIAVNPQSVSNTEVVGDAVRLDRANRVDFLISLGAMHNSLDSDITVIGANDGAGAASAVFATLNYRTKVGTAAWGAWQQVTDSKIDVVTGGEIDPAADDNMILNISVSAAELQDVSATAKYVNFAISAGGQYAYLVSAVSVLTGLRYSDDIPPVLV